MRVHHHVRHGFDLLLLVLILSLGLGGMLFFVGNKSGQILSVIVMCALYVFWGIYHHHHDRNLTVKIALEYTGIAILVTALLSLFLLRI